MGQTDGGVSGESKPRKPAAERLAADEIEVCRGNFSLSKIAIFRLQHGGTVRMPDGTVVKGPEGMRNYMRIRRIRTPLLGRLEGITGIPVKKRTFREKLAGRRRLG